MNMLDFEIASEFRDKVSHGILKPLFCKLTFPDHYHMPAESLKGGNISGVPFFIPAYLLLPKADISTWLPVTGLPRMTVPETTVNEYYRMILPQHKVRLARKSL